MKKQIRTIFAIALALALVLIFTCSCFGTATLGSEAPTTLTASPEQNDEKSEEPEGYEPGVRLFAAAVTVFILIYELGPSSRKRNK